VAMAKIVALALILALQWQQHK
jgi:hypothetical protein